MRLDLAQDLAEAVRFLTVLCARRDPHQPSPWPGLVDRACAPARVGAVFSAKRGQSGGIGGESITSNRREVALAVRNGNALIPAHNERWMARE